MKVLKKRTDFLALRSAKTRQSRCFLLAGRSRDDGQEEIRIGFTVTKKLGGAVTRNRIKRRLKSAARLVINDHGKAGFDYVLIARRAALTRKFEDLLDELKQALLTLPSNSK